MNFESASQVRSIRLLLCYASIATFIGCSGSALSPTSGTVMVNGQPAEGALLVFHPKTNHESVGSLRPYAVVGPTGEFQVSTFTPHDGIPPARYDVTLFWGQDGTTEQSPDRLRNKYMSPSSPVCTIDITRGVNKMEPIDVSVTNLLPPKKSSSPKEAGEMRLPE